MVLPAVQAFRIGKGGIPIFPAFQYAFGQVTYPAPQSQDMMCTREADTIALYPGFLKMCSLAAAFGKLVIGLLPSAARPCDRRFCFASLAGT